MSFVPYTAMRLSIFFQKIMNWKKFEISRRASGCAGNMEDHKERRKKSDKSKDKEGRPSSRRVREYEAMIERKGIQGEKKEKTK